MFRALVLCSALLLASASDELTCSGEGCMVKGPSMLQVSQESPRNNDAPSCRLQDSCGANGASEPGVRWGDNEKTKVLAERPSKNDAPGKAGLSWSQPASEVQCKHFAGDSKFKEIDVTSTPSWWPAGCSCNPDQQVCAFNTYEGEVQNPNPQAQKVCCSGSADGRAIRQAFVRGSGSADGREP